MLHANLATCGPRCGAGLRCGVPSLAREVAVLLLALVGIGMGERASAGGGRATVVCFFECVGKHPPPVPSPSSQTWVKKDIRGVGWTTVEHFDAFGDCFAQWRREAGAAAAAGTTSTSLELGEAQVCVRVFFVWVGVRRGGGVPCVPIVARVRAWRRLCARTHVRAAAPSLSVLCVGGWPPACAGPDIPGRHPGSLHADVHGDHAA